MVRWALDALLVLVLVLGAAVAAAPSSAVDAGTVPAPPGTVLDNEFIPDRDLDDCVSALPQPNCGSEGRSGWRQTAVLVVIVAGLAFIAWRIVRGARRVRRERMTPDEI